MTTRHRDVRAADSLERSIRAAELRWLETWVRGPIDVAVTDLPPQVGDAAPDADLRTVSGEWRRLAAAWATGTVLVVFLREFGCRCAHERMRRFDGEARRLRQLGAQVVAICQAEPIRAAEFASLYTDEVTLLCDPDLHAYGAYGLREGTLAEVLFDIPPFQRDHSRRRGLELMERGRAAGMPRGDNPWIIPAEFVVDPSGTIRLAYRYQHRCDLPDPELLFAAVEEATEAGRRDRD